MLFARLDSALAVRLIESCAHNSIQHFAETINCRANTSPLATRAIDCIRLVQISLSLYLSVFVAAYHLHKSIDFMGLAVSVYVRALERFRRNG